MTFSGKFRGHDCVVTQERTLQLLRDMGLQPGKFRPRDFVTALQDHNQRPIKLTPHYMARPPWGYHLSYESHDEILYASNAGHQDVIILHEAMHIALGHRGEPVSPEVAQELLPDLDPQMVQHYLRRCGWDSDSQEMEAEAMARMTLGYSGFARGG